MKTVSLPISCPIANADCPHQAHGAQGEGRGAGQVNARNMLRARLPPAPRTVLFRSAYRADSLQIHFMCMVSILLARALDFPSAIYIVHAGPVEGVHSIGRVANGPAFTGFDTTSPGRARRSRPGATADPPRTRRRRRFDTAPSSTHEYKRRESVHL